MNRRVLLAAANSKTKLGEGMIQILIRIGWTRECWEKVFSYFFPFAVFVLTVVINFLKIHATQTYLYTQFFRSTAFVFLRLLIYDLCMSLYAFLLGQISQLF